eukprot:1192889-Prorocentrum_minimum.AAC.3
MSFDCPTADLNLVGASHNLAANLQNANPTTKSSHSRVCSVLSSCDLCNCYRSRLALVRRFELSDVPQTETLQDHYHIYRNH